MIFRFVIGILFGAGIASATRAADSLPNFIVILIDDMGHTDLGCQGSTFYQTPEIDRLAREGVRCTTAYAACTVCSPTRAAMMTGKYPARLHITDWIAGHNRPFAKLRIPDWQKSLPLSEQTIPEVLAERGYVSASFGKWHLGGEGQLPTDQGFVLHRGGLMHGQPPSYFDPYKLPLLPDRRPGEYLTDRLTDEVTDFLTARAKEPSKPFFVYLPHFTVHTPLQAKPGKIEQAKQRVDENNPQKNPTYAAMIASLDESVGKVRAQLDELNLSKNTIVIFTSDNGGLANVTSNLPFRAGKGSAYEGGVRVPFIAWGPGNIPAGKTDATPLMTIDVLPTLAEWAGVKKLPPDVDGVSLAQLLTKQTPLADRSLCWHYPHYHPGGATPYSAIRRGDYRLVEFFEDSRAELYNLKNDVGEKLDLSQKESQKAAELRKLLADWRTSIGAQLPTANPDFDLEKEKNAGQKNQKKGSEKKKQETR